LKHNRLPKNMITSKSNRGRWINSDFDVVFCFSQQLDDNKKPIKE